MPVTDEDRKAAQYAWRELGMCSDPISAIATLLAAHRARGQAEALAMVRAQVSGQFATLSTKDHQVLIAVDVAELALKSGGGT